MQNDSKSMLSGVFVWLKSFQTTHIIWIHDVILEYIVLVRSGTLHHWCPKGICSVGGFSYGTSSFTIA